MERLNDKERELVALGAAVASNCVPCIVHHVAVAKKIGIADEQITEAVELADKVKRVPAEQVLRTAYARIGRAPARSAERSETASDCGC